MRQTLMLLLGVIAVGCPAKEEPPAPPEPPKENLVPKEQPWMVNTYVPQEVEVGDEFEMRITLINRSDEEQVLESVHLSEEYFKGVEVLKTSPSRESQDSHLGPGVREYPLGLRVGGKRQGGMVATVRAVAEGTYYPNITVCVTHPRSEWTDRYDAVCAGHPDVPEGMATNSQPMAHAVRKVEIKKKSEGE